MAEDNKVDLTAQLPDEVLMEIFGHLPSLCDKLRLESVNTRFQRCIIKLLRTRPIPFLYDGIWGKRLKNGYDFTTQFADALKSLGNKVKFSSIDIRVLSSEKFDSVLSALVSSDIDCLDKVTTVKVLSETGCNETLLSDLFAKCTKLSDVRLDFREYFPLDLSVLLEGKPLTQLSVDLFDTQPEQVMQMFQSIKPNTLKKIDLLLENADLNMDVLVTELCGGGWSALEEMDIDWTAYNLPIDKIFSSLNRLPKLRKCNFKLMDMRHELVAALTSLSAGLASLFANHAEITVEYLTSRDRDDFGHNPTGCRLVALIRQVQSVHPELDIGFGPIGRFLALTQGKVSFKQNFPVDLLAPCNNAECPECRIFYPTVLSRIVAKINEIMYIVEPDQLHLANARLDRCKIDSITDCLNQTQFRDPRLKALAAEMNEDRNLATITFKAPAGHDIKITVDCGHCLTNGCFVCL